MKNNSVKNNKEQKSIGLSPKVINQLEQDSKKHGLAISEIVEFALLKFYNMSTDECRIKLYKVFENPHGKPFTSPDGTNN